jgi:hypothetical protein
MRRIPILVADFVTWWKNANTFLQSDDPANPGHKQWERLGLSNAEQTWWDDNNTAVQALWDLYSSKDTRTLTVMRQLRDLRRLLTRGGRGIVNRIATSPVATEQDASIFNFVLNRKEPTRRKSDIKEQLFAAVERSGSAEYLVKCRYDISTKLPKLLPGSDGIEVSYMISKDQPAEVGTINPEGDGFKQKTFSAPRFLFKAGAGNKGRFLVIAFRWNYSPNTDFNGPWTDVVVMVIS